MATLVLGAVGSLIGGPFGMAIGSLVGSQIDNKLLGPAAREGPRLKELSVTTSSYGGPIPQQIGQLRSAGTIIWATDFQEHSETSGGKGRPKVTSFSYSVSFAVVLASNPIDRVGRIWADGNLLRGAAGDLKTAGSLRVHSGHGDQDADPLLQAALGQQCPAHRGCAYAVFEDLAIADFGNRIPALTFEIFAGDGKSAITALAGKARAEAAPGTDIPELIGFSNEGGELAGAISLLASAGSIAPDAAASPVRLTPLPEASEARMLGEAVAWEDGEFGGRDGSRQDRSAPDGREFAGLRYYDVDRDYQPGVQRRAAQASPSQRTLLDFPASLNADGARRIADRVATRDSGERERRLYRSAALDPAIGPASLVRLPAEPGLWRVEGWEWRDGGVELELVRHFERDDTAVPTSPGMPWVPPDRLPGDLFLEGFELPWDGISGDSRGTVYAAIGSSGGRWSGAAIYAERSGALVPVTQSGSQSAVLGKTASLLPPSNALMMEPRAALSLRLYDPGHTLATTSIEGIAAGENRLLVGDEILQFQLANVQPDGSWLLTGLLRGRGGTEGAARAGAAIGTPIVLLDDRLVELDRGALAGSSGIAAIGLAEAEPVTSEIALMGSGERPLSPVHARVRRGADGSLMLCWTRRARGAWRWLDGVSVPLVEEVERYEIGCGPVEAPALRWEVGTNELMLGSAAMAEIAASHAGEPLWVRQIGSFGLSPALFLTNA